MTVKNLWIDEILDGFKLEDLDGEAVAKVESLLSIKLPESYLDLLKGQNGGCLNPNKIVGVSLADKSEHYVEEDFLELGYVLGVSPKRNEGLLENLTIREYSEISDRLVSFCGDGQCGYFFDYRNHEGNNPPITFIDSFSNVDFQVARDFEELLNKLEARPNVAIFEEWEREGLTFTPEEIEKAINERSETIEIGNKKVNAMLGLEYLAQKEYDLNWFLNQMKGLVGYENYLMVFDGIGAFSRRIKSLKKSDIETSKMSEVLDTLMNYPNDTPEQDVINSVRKIKKFISVME